MIFRSAIVSHLLKIMNSRKTSLVLMAVLISCSAAIAQRKASHPSEQTHFSAEDSGVHNPVPLPDDVLAILKEDEGVRNMLESDNIPADKIPLSWFAASVIHLHAPEEKDMVVEAQDELRGANTNRFWIFRPTARGYELILDTMGHDLLVKKKRSKGYRDIELLAVIALKPVSVLYRFDGKQYTD
jgi:hypothetical protein